MHSVFTVHVVLFNVFNIPQFVMELVFNFTQFVILENLSVLDLALSGVKGLRKHCKVYGNYSCHY